MGPTQYELYTDIIPDNEDGFIFCLIYVDDDLSCAPLKTYSND